jgi:hypothetical protein
MTKGQGGCGPELMLSEKKRRISALRCAPGEMTKGRVVVGPELMLSEKKSQISPLRCASVEMTKGRTLWSGSEAKETETAGPSTSLRSGRDDKGGRGAFRETPVCGIPHLAKNERDAPNFLYAALERTACAPLFQGEAHEVHGPTKLHRKSGCGAPGGGGGHRAQSASP